MIEGGIIKHFGDGDALPRKGAEGRTGIDAGKGFMKYDESGEEIVGGRDGRPAALERRFRPFGVEEFGE